MPETKYTLYPDAEQPSRPRYFSGQFLGTQDFIDEQRYHADRLRRSLRHLRIAGVCHGLTVDAVAPLELRVAPGTALDDSGRQLVLTAPHTHKLPADTPRPAGYVLTLAYGERGDRPQGGQQGGLGAEGDTRFAEDPQVALLRDDQLLPPGHVALAALAVAQDGAVTVTTPPAVRRYSGLRLPGPGGRGPALASGGDPDPDRLVLTGDLTVRRGLVVDGVAHLGVAHVATRSFKLAGDPEKFYPVVFADDGWSDGACELELSRADVHTDVNWRGSLMARLRWHSSRFGHGSEFDGLELYQYRIRFVARTTAIFKVPELVIWLRGQTTYRWRANHSTTLAYADAAATTRGDTELPVLAAVDAELDRDRLQVGPTQQFTRLRSPLTVDGDLTYGGKLSKLDTAEVFTATIRSADLQLGHSGRRGTPGRALADGKDVLLVNAGTDWQKLHLAGEVTIPDALAATANPIWMTSAWAGRPDAALNVAEISNDTAASKTLMIVGNRSAQLPWPNIGRRVSVWDRLEVNGHLLSSESIAIGITPSTRPKQPLHVHGRMYLEHGVIQRGGDPILTTTDLGLYSQVASQWIRYVTTNSRHVFFTDGGIGTAERLSIEPDGAVTINGTLTAGNLSTGGNITYTGTQSRLDTAEQNAAIVRAADLKLGHSTRRGTPGRALVDNNTALILNYGSDWPRVQVPSELELTGPGLTVRAATFKVAGDVNKFYPVVFTDTGWYDGPAVLELTRADVHRDGNTHGALQLRVQWHATNWGHGAEFDQLLLTQREKRFVARHGFVFRTTELVLWLRGNTTYSYRGERQTVTLASNTAAALTRGEENFPVLDAVDAYLDTDRLALGPTAPTRLRGNLVYDGTQNKLDTAEQWAATLRITDLRIGHSTRRGDTGRALVDNKDSLILNCGPDWPKVQIPSELEVGGPLTVRSATFKVAGDNTKFYPVVFTDTGWYDGPATLELTRADVHRDAEWFGSLQLLIRWHSSHWGNGAEFDELSLYQHKRRFIARHYFIIRNNELVVWLRGNTTYNYRGDRQTVTLASNTAAAVTRQEETFPVLSAVDSYLDSDRLVLGPPAVATRVRGRLTVDDGVIQRGGAPLGGTSDLGLYSTLDQQYIRYVTTNGHHRFYTDGGIGTNHKFEVAAGGDAWSAGTMNASRLRARATVQVDGGIIQQGDTILTGTDDLGLYSTRYNYWMRYVTNTAPHAWYVDGGIGTTARMTLGTDGCVDVYPTAVPALRLHQYNNTSNYMYIGYEHQGTMVFYHKDGRGCYMPADGTWNRNSDRRLKHDIRPIDDALEIALKLEPVRYTWNDINTPGIGFIAQDVKPLLPELVSETTTGAAPGETLLGLCYESFGPLAIAAIQQLHDRFERRIADLEAQVRELALARRPD